LRSFPLGFLSKELNVPEFCKVRDVGSRTRAHVNLVTDLNHAKFPHAFGQQIHVGAVWRHDGVHGFTGHHRFGNLQAFIDALVGCLNQLLQHDVIKSDGIEIDAGTVGVNLVTNRSNAVEQFVGEAADEVLGRVHPHVGVPGLPIDGPANFVTDLQLVVSTHRVMHRLPSANLRHLHVTVWSLEGSRVPVLAASQWIKERPVKHDVAAFDRRYGRIKSAMIAVLEVFEVQFDRHDPTERAGRQEVCSLRDGVPRAEIFQEAGVFLIGAVNDNGGGFPCDGEGDGRVPEGA